MSKSNSATATTRIMIVDDHPAVREALATRIGQHADMTVCGQAEDSIEALKVYSETEPDIVVTDISLKQSDGIDLIKRLKARDPVARILVWSMYSERLYAERSLHAGAMGYLTKEQATDQIITAIRDIMAGRIFVSPGMREQLLWRAVDNDKTAYHTPTEKLSDREIEVFRLIGEGRKTRDISEQLHISVKTVETHRDRIKKKLELKDGNELLRRAVLWVTEER